MTHPPRPTFVLAAGLLAVGVLALSACGDSAPAATSTPSASFDQSLHDKLPASIQSSRTVRVATDASYAPMSTFAPDGRTIVGMEPDLAAAMGPVLGVTFVFTRTDFTDIAPQLAAGKTDLGMSAITDTPPREKNLDFVNYFSVGTSIVVQRGNPTGISDLKDLCGKTVAVEVGTTQVDLLARVNLNCRPKAIMVKTYPTNSDALVQLRTGRVAAVLNDFPPASHLVNDSRTKANYQLASTTQYEPGLYGMAVPKTQRGLREALQGALEQVMQGGGYATVLNRWGVAAGAVDRVTINSGR